MTPLNLGQTQVQSARGVDLDLLVRELDKDKRIPTKNSATSDHMSLSLRVHKAHPTSQNALSTCMQPSW